MTKRLQYLFVRLWTGLGYFMVLLEWFFVSALYLTLASQQRWFSVLFEKQPEVLVSAPQPALHVETGSMMANIVIVIVVVVLLVAFMYMFRHLPGTIVRSGETVTHVPAVVLTPLLLQHKKLTKQRRLRLTAHLVLLMKVLIIIMPIVLLVPLSWLTPPPLEQPVMWVGILSLAGAALLCFCVEQLLIKFFRLKSSVLD